MVAVGATKNPSRDWGLVTGQWHTPNFSIFHMRVRPSGHLKRIPKTVRTGTIPHGRSAKMRSSFRSSTIKQGEIAMPGPLFFGLQNRHKSLLNKEIKSPAPPEGAGHSQ